MKYFSIINSNIVRQNRKNIIISKPRTTTSMIVKRIDNYLNVQIIKCAKYTGKPHTSNNMYTIHKQK